MLERSNKRKADSSKSTPLSSTKKRRKATKGIAQFGFKVMPYSYYSKRSIACKIITGKKKYSLYVSLSYPYNITSILLNSHKSLGKRYLFLY